MQKDFSLSQIKKVIILSFITLIVNSPHVNPIDINYIKDTYSILSDEYKQCSPIHGAVWLETNLLKKYFKYGNPKDSTIILIRELFYLIGDSFNITNNQGMPAKHFSPTLIGSIIGTIEQHRISDEKGISQEIITLITKDPYFIASNQAARKDITSRLSSFLGIKEISAEQEAEKKQLENLEKNQPRIINDRVKKLAKVIANSLFECGFFEKAGVTVSYPAYATHSILLGFLYKISVDKKSLRDYFNALNSIIKKDQALVKKLFNQEGEHIFSSDSWNLSVFDKSIVEYNFFGLILSAFNESYAKPTIDQFLNTIKQKIPSKYDPFEVMVFSEIVRRFYRKALPKIIGRNAGGHGKTSFANTSFSDCVEVTIRDLCNFIVFSQEESKFIPLKKGNLHPSQELIKYYQGDNANTTSLDLPKKFQEWGSLMQNISGVIYAAMSSKSVSSEKYERLIHGDEIFYSKLAQPCYVLLSKEDMSKLSTTDFGKRKKLNVGNEPYIIGDPAEYNAYALWPSLKNIIILLNHLFGLDLYKDDPLAPFKDLDFCSKYFPKLCENLGWDYDFPVSQNHKYPIGSLNLEYFRWWAIIQMRFINDSNASWRLFIKWHHAEVLSGSGSPLITLPEGFLEKMFSKLLEFEESAQVDSLLALFHPNKNVAKYQSEIQMKPLSRARAKFTDIIFKDDSKQADSEQDELQEKLSDLKSILSQLNAKLLFLKTKLDALGATLH
jgi:hypothetical protein